MDNPPLIRLVTIVAATASLAALAAPEPTALRERVLRAEWAQMAHVPPPAGTRIEREIAYGADPAQRLDLYRPAQAEGAPILVMVHGGGWQRGDKGNPGVVDNKVNHWISKGYIFVSTNYRMVPQADPIAQAGDVAQAVAYVQAHAMEWGGNPVRVVLMGHSAGAHLVALLAAAPEIATRAGVQPWLGTIALDSGAYNVVDIMRRPHLELYDRAFGTDEQLWQAASPTLRLAAVPAPLLLVCSIRRTDSCPPTEAFAEKVRSLKGRAEVAPVDLSHGKINHLLGTAGDYTATVDTFLQSLGLP